MKCPKCGYNSFDHLDSCKKCGQGLTEHKEKFNLRGFFAPGKLAKTEVEPAIQMGDEQEELPDDDTIDFGFDFLDEEDQSGKAADDRDNNSSDKPGKGPEFAF
ncbi:MAG: hypothetical protein RQ722_06755 [Desulfuromonadales bacterium]|nr:hypothetical protein [Desulfuromonadales bacterium]